MHLDEGLDIPCKRSLANAPGLPRPLQSVRLFADIFDLIDPNAVLADQSFACRSRTAGMIRWPGQVPSGVVTNEMPAATDWLPTKYRSEGGDRRKVDEGFYPLTQKKGRFSDEALVVLMCFDIMGESQEETDAEIARGRKMLPYVEKYRKGDPKIAGRAYPDSLLKDFSRKESDFQGAIKAIEHGWRGTWDNPEG